MICSTVPSVRVVAGRDHLGPLPEHDAVLDGNTVRDRTHDPSIKLKIEMPAGLTTTDLSDRANRVL